MRSRVVFLLLGMVVLHAAILWQMRGFIRQGYGDFAAFYTAGKLVQGGQASEIYDRQAQWSQQQEFASQVQIRQAPIPYIRPPFEALVFLPLARLPYPAACVVWMLLKIAILVLIPFLLQPCVTGSPLLPAPLAGVLSLSFFPVAADLLEGQDAVLLLLVFVLAFRALRRGHDWKAGMFLALGLFKFHLVIPIILVFVLRRKGRTVLGFLVTAACLLSVSAALVGWSRLAAYPRYLWDLSHIPGAGLVIPQSMPNVRSLIAALAGGSPVPDYFSFLSAAVVLVGIAFTAWAWRARDDRDPKLLRAGFSLAIVVMLATSYYANSYDLILLLLPILLLGSDFVHALVLRSWPPRIFVATVAVLLCSPLFWVLALRYGQFGWMGLLLLLLLAGSLTATMQLWRTAPTDA